MSEIKKVKCDNCCKEEDRDSMSPIYWTLFQGGSDFEMSFGRSCWDFCSVECLETFVKAYGRE